MIVTHLVRLPVSGGWAAPSPARAVASDDEDPDRLVFRLEALLVAGNRGHILGDGDALDWASQACGASLASLRPGR